VTSIIGIPYRPAQYLLNPPKDPAKYLITFVTLLCLIIDFQFCILLEGHYKIFSSENKNNKKLIKVETMEVATLLVGTPL